MLYQALTELPRARSALGRVWTVPARSAEFTGRDEALHELRPAADATTTYEWVTLEWARSWPSEEIWVAKKR